MTDAEKALWRILRGRQLAGFKFRRQTPMQRYVLDFVCFSHRLVVEVDGGQHANTVERDESRSWILAREGFRVLRFWNNDVLGNRSGVCARILKALGEPAPSPRLSHGGEREQSRKAD